MPGKTTEGFESEIDSLLDFKSEIETTETPESEASEEITENEEKEVIEETDVEETGAETSDDTEDQETDVEVKVKETEISADSNEPDETEDLTSEDLLKKQNELLLARIEELEGKRLKTPVTDPVATKTDLETKTDQLKFISDDADIDELIGSREGLEAFAQKIYAQAVEAASTQIQTAYGSQLPNVITQQVQTQLDMTRGIEDFFSANPDLKVVRRTVGAVTDEVVAEHPDWGLVQVLEEAGKRTRGALGMQVLKQEKTKTKIKTSAPAFATNQTARRPNTDNRSGLQREIDSLIS
jgi:hypothetical protein